MLARGTSGRLVTALRKLPARATTLELPAFSAISTPATAGACYGSLHRALVIRTYASATATKTGTSTRSRSATASKKTTKKPAAKKKKKTAKKAPKKKKKPKKSAATNKKKKPARLLTPEEKRTARVKKLKESALLKEEPSTRVSGYLIYSREHLQGVKGDVTPQVKANSENWKRLSDGEKQRYDSLAAEERRKRQEQYRTWVLGYTPDEIREANSSRSRLNSLRRSLAAAGTPEPKLRLKIYSAISDDRQIKRPASAFNLFVVQQNKDGDLAHLSDAVERMREAARRWRSLSDAELKPYKDESSALRAAWEQKYASLYNREVKAPRKS